METPATRQPSEGWRVAAAGGRLPRGRPWCPLPGSIPTRRYLIAREIAQRARVDEPKALSATSCRDACPGVGVADGAALLATPKLRFPPYYGRSVGALQAIFTKPTSSSIVFSDIEALIIGLGGEVHERQGSRVKILLKGEQWRCHRPHPGKEAKRYQVEEARELLERAGVKP